MLFAPDLLPVGSRDLFGAIVRRPRGIRARWRAKRAEGRLFAAWLRRIEGGELDGHLRAVDPDLLLCDAFLWWAALRALRLGVPTVNVSGNLALPANPSVPPLTTHVRPNASPWSPLRVRAAWWWTRWRLLLAGRRAALCGGPLRCPARMHRRRDLFLRSAARAGYPREENRTYRMTEFGPRLALPEIALCPEPFQLPDAPVIGRRYLGASVDRARAEEPLPAEIDPEKPLVYCSLGGAADLYPNAERCFRAIVAASAAHPQWQFVLHIGDWQGQLPPAPTSLVVRRRVPQLALLARASVMVTHGGTNSVMECIAFGVPMVIVPDVRDHPGNAVRAVHHGIAVTIRMAKVTGDRLGELIERAIADDALRSGLARMQCTIAAAGDGIAATVDFLEESARRAPATPTPRP